MAVFSTGSSKGVFAKGLDDVIGIGATILSNTIQNTGTIVGAATSATNYLTSVDFAQGDYLAVQTDGIPVAGAAADMTIELDFF